MRIKQGSDVTENLSLAELVRIEDPSFYDDAIATYHRLQDEQPVFYYEPLDMFVLSKHDDIRHAAQRTDIFSTTRGLLLTEFMPAPPDAKRLQEEFFDMAGEMFPWTDPPRHRQLRRIVSPAFTPKALARISDELTAACLSLVETIPADEVFDFVDVLAARLPILFASRLLGTAASDQDKIRRWAEAIENIGAGTQTREQLQAQAKEFQNMHAFFLAEMERKRDEHGPDIICTLLDAELDGKPLTEVEILNHCSLIMSTGADTTRSLLSGMAIALAEHPDQLRLLREDRSLMSSAIDEALRWTTPARGFVRTALVDTEIRGQAIRAGQRVYMLYSAGNIDPEAFADPLTFDITREQELQHLGFGFGAHICIAAQLVKLEATTAFNMMLDRFETFELVGEPERVTSILRNGWRNAQMKFRTPVYAA
jgi:cholest-4-en-3-one 26-monooxygenase